MKAQKVGKGATPEKAKKKRRRVLAAMVAVIIAALCGWLWELQHLERPRSAVLILVDTLRADRLGCYGNPLDLTPQIDAFCAQSVRFDQAFSHAPWTLPSTASIFTSRHPAQHGAGGRLGAFSVLDRSVITLAEVMRDAGFSTAVIVNVLFLGTEFGMTQGFDVVNQFIPKDNRSIRTADRTTSEALAWLAEHRDKPFFLVVHYFDPHLVYDPPQPFRSRYADPQDAEAGDFVFGTIRDVVDFRNGKKDLDQSTVERLERLYNGEVAFVDAEIGRLLRGMEDLKLTQNTAIALTGDHGEEFWDHGGFEHGHTHFDELLHIPLLIRAPWLSRADGDEIATPQRVDSVVRHVDLAPTLCDLLAVDWPSSFQGDSLVPLMLGMSEPDRPVLSQGNFWGDPIQAWRNHGKKIIVYQGSGTDLMFDVNQDPLEQHNLVESHGQLHDQMSAELEAVQDALRSGRPTASSPELTDDQLEQLKALGYIK